MIRLSWLPDEFLGKGRLALCCSPGSEERDRDEDLEVLAAAGVTRLICLQEAHELARMVPPENLQERRAAVESFGMRFHHSPIEDYTAPSLEQARELVALVDQALVCGEAVALHCWAGLGRAGTLAACLLVARGQSARDALALVRWVRPGAVQSRPQEDLIADFAASP